MKEDLKDDQADEFLENFEDLVLKADKKFKKFEIRGSSEREALQPVNLENPENGSDPIDKVMLTLEANMGKSIFEGKHSVSSPKIEPFGTVGESTDQSNFNMTIKFSQSVY